VQAFKKMKTRSSGPAEVPGGGAGAGRDASSDEGYESPAGASLADMADKLKALSAQVAALLAAASGGQQGG